MPTSPDADGAALTHRSARRLTVPAVAVLAALLLAGCSSGGEALDAVRERAAAADRVRDYSSVEELVTRTADAPRTRPADAVVVGRFVGAEPGVGMSWELVADGEQTTYLRFADPDAEVHTVHLALEVDEVVAAGRSTDLGQTVQVGLALPPDVTLGDARADAEGLGEVVVFLDRTSPVFGYAGDVWGVLEDGALVGTLDGDAVDLPLLGAQDPLREGEHTLSGLRAAAHRDGG